MVDSHTPVGSDKRGGVDKFMNSQRVIVHAGTGRHQNLGQHAYPSFPTREPTTMPTCAPHATKLHVRDISTGQLTGIDAAVHAETALPEIAGIFLPSYLFACRI